MAGRFDCQRQIAERLLGCGFHHELRITGELSGVVSFTYV